MPGVLPDTPLVVERGKLKLKLQGKYRHLAGERLFARLKQLARLIGREPVMATE
jgi:exopolyphosphatase/guanosine-5'-triphosphate,3'-diphosphate pyrophosphatase